MTQVEACFWFVCVVLCCVPVAIPATCVFPSFCVIVASFAFEVSGQEMGNDGFQAQRRKSWIPGKERADKGVGGRHHERWKEWICKFCSESNVTRWRCNSNIPAGLRGKYRQAISARTGEWSTGSSSSSGGEEKKSRVQEAEIKELRAQVEQLRRQQRGEAGHEGQCDPTRIETCLEEDWNMDVEEEVENKKKLDEQRRTLQKQMRDLG